MGSLPSPPESHCSPPVPRHAICATPQRTLDAQLPTVTCGQSSPLQTRLAGQAVSGLNLLRPYRHGFSRWLLLFNEQYEQTFAPENRSVVHRLQTMMLYLSPETLEALRSIMHKIELGANPSWPQISREVRNVVCATGSENELFEKLCAEFTHGRINLLEFVSRARYAIDSANLDFADTVNWFLCILPRKLQFVLLVNVPTSRTSHQLWHTRPDHVWEDIQSFLMAHHGRQSITTDNYAPRLPPMRMPAFEYADGGAWQPFAGPFDRWDNWAIKIEKGRKPLFSLDSKPFNSRAPSVNDLRAGSPPPLFSRPQPYRPRASKLARAITNNIDRDLGRPFFVPSGKRSPRLARRTPIRPAQFQASPETSPDRPSSTRPLVHTQVSRPGPTTGPTTGPTAAPITAPSTAAIRASPTNDDTQPIPEGNNYPCGVAPVYAVMLNWIV